MPLLYFDDAFHPEMIQRMLEAMMQHDAEIVTCNYAIYHMTKPMPLKQSNEIK